MPAISLPAGTVTVSLISSPSSLYICAPKAGLLPFTTITHVCGLSFCQTVKVGVLRPMLIATVLNECGLPVCTVVGLKPQTLA